MALFRFRLNQSVDESVHYTCGRQLRQGQVGVDRLSSAWSDREEEEGKKRREIWFILELELKLKPESLSRPQTNPTQTSDIERDNIISSIGLDDPWLSLNLNRLFWSLDQTESPSLCIFARVANDTTMRTRFAELRVEWELGHTHDTIWGQLENVARM